MLVVVANWGIADGTLVSPPRHDQVAWLRAVRRAVIRAGFRHDGRYQPPDRADIVLAGDTFDLLTSTAWTADTRPWHRGPRSRAARERVLAAAAARGGRLLAGLRRWARAGLAVPRAGRHGRPAPGTETLLPVGVSLLSGDRDGWLEDAQPVAARHRLPLGVAWSGSACEVRVRHGHEFDPFTCGECEVVSTRDRGPTLAESLAVDLVARFGGLLAADAARWPAARPLVAALAGARPAQMAAAFRRWRQVASAPPPAVGDLWKKAVEAWWREARRNRPACGVEYDPVDAVAATLGSASDAAAGAAAVPFDPPCGLPGGGAADDGRVLVLGHPLAPVGNPTATDGPAIICLGRTAARRGGPATAILTRHDDRVRQDWLHDDPDAAIVATRGHAPATIVEAA